MGVGTVPLLNEPVTDAQWAAVITQSRAISVPEQPNAPLTATLATAPKLPAGASWPPTTRGLAAYVGAASRSAAMTPMRPARLIGGERRGGPAASPTRAPTARRHCPAGPGASPLPARRRVP